MGNGKTYLVAGSRPWSRQVFEETISGFEGNWHFVGDAKDALWGQLDTLKPRYIFFLHWSDKVPRSIWEQHECVCFHMTDVPYGRGGSPLQNLIVRGHKETRMTALRMVEDFDAGPVYDKRPLSLEGRAQDIFLRGNRLSAEMIQELIAQEPTPVPQEGEVEIFKRRKPEDSDLRNASSVEDAYDYIRMLDADGYPPAFLKTEDLELHFSEAEMENGALTAKVKVIERMESQ